MLGYSETQVAISIAAALAMFAVLYYGRLLMRKLARKLPASTISWRSYLRGQGVILFGFLLLGSVLATLTTYFGPQEGMVSTGGRAMEYLHLNPSEHAIYEEQDVSHVRRICVMARATAPSNGSATIVIYDDPVGSSAQEISRLPTVTDSWSQWTQTQNASKHITLKIMDGGSGPAATQVDVLVYLYPD